MRACTDAAADKAAVSLMSKVLQRCMQLLSQEDTVGDTQCKPHAEAVLLKPHNVSKYTCTPIENLLAAALHVPSSDMLLIIDDSLALLLNEGIWQSGY